MKAAITRALFPCNWRHRDGRPNWPVLLGAARFWGCFVAFGLALLGLLSCASNVARIGPDAGDTAIRVESDAIYVNPDLLGFGDVNENVTITTNHNNTLSFEMSPAARDGDAGSVGKAF